MNFRIISLLICLLAPSTSGAEIKENSLYDRLGGKEAITKVIDDFVGNVAKDNRINKYFEKTNIIHLKSQLVDQVCEAAGGPCKYNGQDMKTAHAGMGITSNEFEALVEDLKTTLNKFKVPQKDQSNLLAILGPMKKDIVEK